MPEKQQQPRRNNNSRPNRPQKHNNDRDNSNKEEKRRPFVPWLGEERPGKGPIIDLAELEGKKVHIVFEGGREIIGTLTGSDILMNIVLEDAVEVLGDNKTRELGKVIARGPLLETLNPVEGMEDIENPF